MYVINEFHTIHLRCEISIEPFKRMANRTDKTDGNATGPYYVDDTCVDCDICRTTASQLFKRNDVSGCSIVYRQPETGEEIALAGVRLKARGM
jgi:ferredoxin